MQMNLLLVALVALFLSTQAFRPSTVRYGSALATRSALSMGAEGDQPFQEEDTEAKLKFDMNKRVRLGRSRDQDGKSNIWSIEPTMEVEEGTTAEDGGKKNLFIGVAIIGVAVAALPLFSLFTKLLPDPSDF